MELIPYKDKDGTWRIDGVPLVTTGIEYPLSTGPATFTEDQLADAVLATGDPAIKDPRIKLGHTSGYNAALVGDAEQAFGRVENLRLGNHGQTVFGDYVGMPEWLATVVPMAYPSRSIEGDLDIVTNTGHSYKTVIYAVSLLGVRWPGVSTLEDLPLYYGSDTPPEVEVDFQDVFAANGGDMKPGDRIKAAVDIDMVCRSFYSEVATGDNYWWWIRAERYDDSQGLQLIVDRDDGTLVRVPVSVSGSDINFGDPTEVTEEYPDKIAASAFVAGLATTERHHGADVLVFASRADTTQDRPEVRATQPQGETMDDATRKSLATRVGLDPETATEDEVNVKITELAAAATPPAADGGEGTDGGDDGDKQDAPAPVVQQPVVASAETVTVDKAAWDQVVQQAAQGASVAATIQAQQTSDFLDTAVKAGKFPPARKEHYQKLMAADPDGTKVLIDGLAEGTIPVGARGAAGNGGEEAGVGTGGDDGLLGMDSKLDADIRNIRAGKIPNQHGRVTMAREA